jgi:U3 small nucleolar ribonucleoprotein component
MTRQWEDVESYIRDGNMDGAGVAIAEIITAINDDELDGKLESHDIETLAEAIEDNFIG